MKHVHFFGCSFTVGDELADDDFFPWKKQCSGAEEYYQTRNKYLSDRSYLEKYVNTCKLLAYPNLLCNDEIKTYNHARLGASVGECVFLIMKLFDSGLPVDQIFFQLPPFPRELIMYKKDVSSLQLASVGRAGNNIVNETYIKSKLENHESYQWAAEDLMNIIMINSYLQAKKVQFRAINLTIELPSRINILPGYASFIKKEVEQSVQVIDFNSKLDLSHRCMGYHYNSIAHNKIKEVLQPIIQAD